MFYFVIRKQMESATDKLNVLTNVLDVPTDLVRTKSGGNCLLLGYANGVNGRLWLPLWNVL